MPVKLHPAVSPDIQPHICFEQLLHLISALGLVTFAVLALLVYRKRYVTKVSQPRLSLCEHAKGLGKCQVPSLIDATSEQLIAGLSQGCFTSKDLINVSHHELLDTFADFPINYEKAYLGRIIEVNSSLHAVAEANPDAWSIAAELDFERAHGRTRG